MSLLVFPTSPQLHAVEMVRRFHNPVSKKDGMLSKNGDLENSGLRADVLKNESRYGFFSWVC